MTALAQHLYPLNKVADGAFERDDCVARRKISQASAHGFDFGAHRVDVDRSARIGSLAAHVIELNRQGPNVVEQQLRERRGVFRADFGRRATCPRTASSGPVSPRPARSSISWRRMAICETAALRSNGAFGSNAVG